MTLPQALMRHILYNIYEVYDTHTYVRSIIFKLKVLKYPLTLKILNHASSQITV